MTEMGRRILIGLAILAVARDLADLVAQGRVAGRRASHHSRRG